MLVKSFHRGILAAALSLPIISFSIQSALAESISFTLINRSSRTLVEFYADYPTQREWGDDILGRDVLAPGESTTITIGNAHEDCRYDFLGVLGPSDDGTVGRGELIQTNVEVCDGGSYEYTD